jgi:hypothetical protein
MTTPFPTATREYTKALATLRTRTFDPDALKMLDAAIDKIARTTKTPPAVLRMAARRMASAPWA